VIDGCQRSRAARTRPRQFLADCGVPGVSPELLLHRGRARAVEAPVGLEVDVAQPRHGAQQGAGRLGLALARFAERMSMQCHRRVAARDEGDAGQLRDEKLSGVAHPERELDVADLVVEVDAGRAPHDDFFGLIALEQIDSMPVHAGSGGGVPMLVVDDAAAIGWTTNGDVVEAEEVEDRSHGLHQMRRTEHVTAEVEHDGMGLPLARRRSQPPRAVLGPRRQVLERGDLPEVALVVVSQVSSRRHVAGTRVTSCRSITEQIGDECVT
jgi:hypothetical protein